MALIKKVYGVRTPISPRIFAVHGVFDHHLKSPKILAPQLVIGHLLPLELKLGLVRNQGDELRVGGLSFCIGYGVAEEPLQGIQVAPVPGHLDGVADGLLHPVGHGQKCLDDLACTAFVKIRSLKERLPQVLGRC